MQSRLDNATLWRTPPLVSLLLFSQKVRVVLQTATRHSRSRPGLHGFTNQGTIFPSPIGLAATFNEELVKQVANVTALEGEALGINHFFAPVLDLARELRWGRVEETFGEDPFLTGEIGRAFVTGMQSGKRRGAGPNAIARAAATCKHFAAFGSPQGGL